MARYASVMSLPRRIIPGATTLLTRRCSERRLFLLPDETITATFDYVLAVSCERYGVLLHAYVVLGNHYHIVATDPLGVLPRLSQDLNAIVARAVNAERGHWEHFWDASDVSYVHLVDPGDMLEKIVYTITNPVSSWLVERSELWPGARSRAQDFVAGPRTARRPDHLARFFSKDSKMPETAQLELVPPPDYEDLSAEEFAELVEERVQEREKELRAQRKREGGGFLGLEAIVTQSPDDAPTSFAPRRERNPHVACKNPAKRRAILAGLKRFREAYRVALADYRARKRDILFPFGTWWMRVFHCIPCAGPP